MPHVLESFKRSAVTYTPYNRQALETVLELRRHGLRFTAKKRACEVTKHDARPRQGRQGGSSAGQGIVLEESGLIFRYLAEDDDSPSEAGLSEFFVQVLPWRTSWKLNNQPIIKVQLP